MKDPWVCEKPRTEMKCCENEIDCEVVDRVAEAEAGTGECLEVMTWGDGYTTDKGQLVCLRRNYDVGPVAHTPR